MRKLWVMLCIPVIVDETKLVEGITPAMEAQDEAWQRVINPDEPPEGLIEVVVDELPRLNCVPALIEGARIEEADGQLIAEPLLEEEHEATTLAREDVEEAHPATGHTEDDKEAAA